MDQYYVGVTLNLSLFELEEFINMIEAGGEGHFLYSHLPNLKSQLKNEIDWFELD